MSFSSSATSSSVPGLNLKKFESQNEVDEKRKKRQEEWEKVRQPDDPEEFPEQPIDNRCLYDKLEEQKLKKQEEHDEKFAFKNQVRRLDADETNFLDFCSERQHEINQERKQEEQEILSEMQNAKVVKLAENNMEEKKSRTAALPKQQQGKRSQVALLAGAVKRKGSEELSSSKKSKTEDTELNGESSSTMNTESSNDKQSSRSQLAQVIGVLPAALPGLTEYDDSSDSISTSDDSEFEFSMTGKTAVIVRQVAQHHQ